VEIQWALGADVAMALDHVVPSTATRAEVEDALRRTGSWLARCRARHDDLTAPAPGRQALWPILQGATHADLRRTALAATLDAASWTGLAVGGLAVGEPVPAAQATPEGLQTVVEQLRGEWR